MDEKSVSEVPKSPTVRRRFHTALQIIVLLVGIGLLLLASLWTNRPHWRTLTESVTLTGSATAGSRVVMDCPDDWVIMDDKQLGGGPGRYLVIQHREPTGLMRWWNEHVSPVNHHPANRTRIMITLYLGSGLKKTGMIMDIDKLERTFGSRPRSQSGYRLTAARMSHPLGPALAVQMDRTKPPAQRGAPQTASFTPQHDESLYICPAHEKEDDIAWIAITCSAPQIEYPRLKLMFDKVMQSVRLLKK